MKGGQIIGVYEDVTEDDIADYADGHEMLKILVAYDSCRKRLKRFPRRYGKRASLPNRSGAFARIRESRRSKTLVNRERLSDRPAVRSRHEGALHIQSTAFEGCDYATDKEGRTYIVSDAAAKARALVDISTYGYAAKQDSICQSV